MAAKTVKVEMVGFQRVTCIKEVEMSREHFKEYEKLIKRHGAEEISWRHVARRLTELAVDYGLHNAQSDWDDLEGVTIERIGK
jgi:hypothetical protein